MEKLKNIFVAVCLLIFAQTNFVFGQGAKINPFQIKPSTVLEDVKTAKANNPNQSVENLVKAANESLQTNGFNYVFGFDTATCQKIEQVKTSQKDKTVPLNLRATFNSVDGEKASVVLPEANFATGECLPCFMQIPVFEVTTTDFVTSVMQRNIKFYFPSNFVVHEIQAVEKQDLTTVIKRWKMPFRTTPLSISDDGNVIYLGFSEPELNDLVLMVFSEGVLMFEAKKDLNSTKKVTMLKDFPSDANNPNLRFINFADENVSHTIRFSVPCS